MTDYSIGGSSGTTGVSQLTAPAPGDKIPVVDVSDTTTAPAGSAGSDKYMTVATLGSAVQPGVINIGLAGGTGTNTSADTTLIQSLISGAPAGSTILFDKLYKVNATIQFAGGLTYQGINQQTGLQMADSANLAALAAPVGWAANTATVASQPVTIRDMAFNGPPTVPQASGTGHLLVMNNFWSYVEDCTFGYNIGQGVRLDACTANNTQILSSGAAVQNRFHRCQFYQCQGGSIATNDPSGAFTDGFITDCIFEAGNADVPSVAVQNLAGWEVGGSHFFGNTASVIQGRPFMTRITGNYIETWGTSVNSGLYAAVDFSTLFVADQGYGSVIEGNVMFLSTAAGNSGTYIVGIAVTASSGQQATVAITGNQLTFAISSPPTLTYFGVALGGQTATGTVQASVSGNDVTGWPSGNVTAGNLDSSTVTNVSISGDMGGYKQVLATTFTSASSTSAQSVTGMAVTLQPGAYLLKGRFWYVGAGTVGDTETFAWTFGGTASSAVVTWQSSGSAYVAPTTGTSITFSWTSPTKTTTTYPLDFEAHVTVTAAGVLQLKVTNLTAGADEVSVLAGSYLNVQPAVA